MRAKPAAAPETAYLAPILPAMLNTGRYIDTTKPPNNTAKNAMINGSKTDIMVPTAESTSSS